MDQVINIMIVQKYLLFSKCYYDLCWRFCVHLKSIGKSYKNEDIVYN